MKALFDWINEPLDRKAVTYAAVSAQADMDETFEEFQSKTSGWNSQRSYELWKARRREQASNLFSYAGRKGFIDC